MHSINRIKLKVCGMRNPGNIREVAALHPDYMGFIFYPGSKRVVGEDFQIPTDFPPRTKRVGVFVNETTENMMMLAIKHSLDFIQLHGEEPVAQCDELQKSGIKVIKAFSIDHDFNFDQLLPYKKVVDYFLFDTKGAAYGGTGKTFDWLLLKKYDQEIPFFLSGGLSLETIDKINELKGMNMHALDVNSGVEIEPGMKDVRLIEEIQMRRLNSHWLER